MRVRDHIALSAIAAALVSPWLGRGAAGLVVGGVFIDADHYAWFCLCHRRVSPRAAVRFFNQADTPHHHGTRVLHTPAAVAAVLCVGLRHHQLLPVAAGMGLHVVLDTQHEARMGRARKTALARDGFSCRACGSRAAVLGTHIWRQPRLLPSYGPQNLVVLCALCHEAAHAVGRHPVP